jgi:alkanesulfonate monooxygenase SsuD/methylene tetrahydromethanopterin reductase-like flavin-dependent oxidoreductase (luciferase family)
MINASSSLSQQPEVEGEHMKFGMLHFFEHPAGGKSERQIFREQFDCVRAAEGMGFDSIWAPEHHSIGHKTDPAGKRSIGFAV